MHHPRALLAVVLAGAVAALAGCNDRDDRSTADTQADPVPMVDPTGAPADAPPPDTATADAGALAADARADAGPASEQAALGVLNAINEHEIAAGKQALAKGVSGPVAAYAQLMIDQHGENRAKTSALGADAGAADAAAQRDQGEQELKALDARSGDAYAKAYVDAMVKGHTGALATLDTRLIPAATTPAVKDHLAATRAHVAQHLERARALQSGDAR